MTVAPTFAVTRSSSSTLREARRRVPTPIAGLAVLAVLGLMLPAMTSSYWLFVLAQVLFYVLATQGLYLLFGQCGQLSLAHGAFIGVGAYVGVLSATHGVPVELSILLSMGAAVLFGVIQSIPAVRLSGLRLSIVTLAFGFLFAWSIENSQSTTGGTQGLVVPPVQIGGLSLLEPRDAFWVGLGVAYVSTLLTVQITRSRFGIRMLAVRDSDEAARSVGVDVTRTKVIAFALGAAYAGLAGWLIAFSSGFIAAANFDLFASAYLLVAVILGGAGSVAGSWLGAAYVVLVPRLFSAVGLSSSYPLAGGILLVLIALLAPDGIVGLFRDGYWWIRGVIGRATPNDDEDTK